MIKISFVQMDLRRILGATLKEERIVEAEVNSMQFRCATDFLSLLRRNIMTQKFAGTYARLNPKYRAWKEQYGRSGLNFWSLFGDLVKSLERRREGTRTKKTSKFFVGIPRGARDKGGKSWFGKGDKGPPKSINFYATMGEYGRRGQPARPLFGPTQDEYVNSGRWAKRGVESLGKLFVAWS